MEKFARELVGKRPNNKVRDTLEDIASRIDVPVVSCRRQFENLRRVYKRVISMNHNHQQGPLTVTDRITANFRISPKLAAYAQPIDVEATLHFISFPLSFPTPGLWAYFCFPLITESTHV